MSDETKKVLWKWLPTLLGWAGGFALLWLALSQQVAVTATKFEAHQVQQATERAEQVQQWNIINRKLDSLIAETAELKGRIAPK